MKPKTLITVISTIFLIAAILINSRPTASTVIKRTKHAYRDLKSFYSTVTVTIAGTYNGEPVKIERMGEVRLGRPNFYNVAWQVLPPEPSEPGVIWNSGAGAFFYYDGSYHESPDDRTNFIAGGVPSVKIAATIPHLFYATSNHLFKKLQDVTIVGEEAFLDQDCIVLQGRHPDGAISKIWVAKKSYLILKTLESGKTADSAKQLDLSDEALKKFITGMGEQPTPENLQDARKRLEEEAAFLKTVDLQFETTEIYENIKVNEPFDAASMEFEIPEGSVLEKGVESILPKTMKAPSTEVPGMEKIPE